MKKRILSIVLALCLVFSLLPVSALADTTSNKCGDNLTWALSYSGTLTISGTGAMNSYSSSKNTDGDYVTTAPWREYYRLIKRVVIGNGVTSIGWSAFEGCSSLTSVTIPDTVTSIGWSAFEGCTGLASVTIPDSVTSIGDWAFCDCSSLTSVTIPDTVTRIGYNAFEGCNSLTSVTIPDNVTSISSDAFYGCTSLASVTIPDSVTSIGNYTFEGCSSLTSVTIGNGVTSIGDDAFFGCSSIKDVYYTGDVSSWLGISFSDPDSNPCRYGANLYFDGKLLTDIVIPDSVTSIGSDAFYGCTSLTSVTMPDSVTSIGDSAFFGCSNLSSVTIPVSVTSIGEQAFEGCSNFKEVYYSASIGEWTAISIGSSNDSLTNAKLHCTDGNLIYYGKCDDSHIWTLDESGTLTISGEGAMSNYSTSKNTDGYFVTTAPWRKCYRLINRVVIDDGVTSVGERAFYGCNSLTSVTIPDGVTSIGMSAFNRCNSLTSVTIPDGVTSIGSYAFNSCSNLSSAIIPDSVTSIGEQAFINCSSLTNITIPDSVKSIGENAFDFCSKLKDVAFSGSKTAWQAIGYSFINDVRIHYNCTSLEGHFVPMEVKETSCESAGYISYGCACGHEYKVMIPQNHNYVFSKTVAPTCSEHGYDLFVCSKCGGEKKEYKDDKLQEHSYQATVFEPTCLNGGYTLHKCSVCGDSYRDELVQPLGHSEVSAEAKAPTCTETGHIAGTCCSRCGKTMSGMEEVAALGHSYKNGSCTRCGAVDPNYIAVPTLSITTSSGKPKISWSAVDGATKYWIYRCTDGKNFKYYDSTTKTSYTNNSTSIGTTYYYKVKAVKTVNGKDIASDYSVVKSIKCTPAAPSLSISRVNGKPKLSWKAVSGATKYWIYRSTDGKNFKYYDSTTKTSYTNSGAASGTKYYYKVKAVAVVNGNNVASAYSYAKSLVCTPATLNVSITSANGKPKLSWNAVSGATKYWIYRSTDGKNFKYYDSTTKTTYTNNSTTVGTRYYYKVKAVVVDNGTSYASAFSSAKSMVVRAAAPTLKTSAPEGTPSLSWNAVNGATKYWIYRSTDGKEFKYYDSTTKTAYTNKSVDAGKTYYYKVKAVNVVNGTSYASGFSNSVSVLVK